MNEERSFLEKQMLKRQHNDPEYVRWSPCETVAELVDSLNCGFSPKEIKSEQKARKWLWEFLFEDRKNELIEQYSENVMWGRATYTHQKDWEELYGGIDECFESLNEYWDEETTEKYRKSYLDPELVFDEIYDLMWYDE